MATCNISVASSNCAVGGDNWGASVSGNDAIDTNATGVDSADNNAPATSSSSFTATSQGSAPTTAPRKKKRRSHRGRGISAPGSPVTPAPTSYDYLARVQENAGMHERAPRLRPQQQQEQEQQLQQQQQQERAYDRRATMSNFTEGTPPPHPNLPTQHQPQQQRGPPHTLPRISSQGGGLDDTNHKNGNIPTDNKNSNNKPNSSKRGMKPGPLDLKQATGEEPLKAAASAPGAAGDEFGALQSFYEYVVEEGRPQEKLPTTDVVWRQTEREKVYNFLLYVPYQLEQIIWFGAWICLDSFLAVMTVLPSRCLKTIFQKLGPSRQNRAAPLHGSQLFDLLSISIVILSALCLRLLQPGIIYYWMKDITSEFLKIQVLFSALEIFDKIFSNFGVDVLEALSGSCTLYLNSQQPLKMLLSDVLVAFAIAILHGAVLMCQGIVFAVAMNSKRRAMLALMIAANFVEIKGTVYKRMDTNKLWNMVCLDVVERFHLVVVLSFVVVEDMDNSATWHPATSTLRECAKVVLWEIVIDIIKHAVLGKFNDIRPGIYREYMRDLCEDCLCRQSHNNHKLITFHPHGPAVLSLRMLMTLLLLKAGRDPLQIWGRFMIVIGIWCALLVGKLILGYMIKVVAHLKIERYNRLTGSKPTPRGVGHRKMSLHKKEE